MIDLYTWPTPNCRKISVALEEMGLDYEPKLVDLSARVQFEDWFLDLNPNNKVPVIVDHDGPGGTPRTVIESGAILLYLARKTGMFLPDNQDMLSEVEQWLFFQTANVGPMFGQLYHFSKGAPEQIPYAIQRYTKEVERVLNVINQRLTKVPYMAGDAYTIADMATYPWVYAGKMLGTDMAPLSAAQRWMEEIGSRDAVKRGMAVPTRPQST